MTNLKFDCKPFSLDDLDSFDPMEEDTQGFDIYEVMRYNHGREDGHFISAINSYGITVAIAGLKEIRPGVAELGVFRSKHYKTHRIGFSRLLKFLVDDYLPELGYHRLEIYVDSEWEQADKWASFLGFTYEGICFAYDKNLKDYKQYSKINREVISKGA